MRANRILSAVSVTAVPENVDRQLFVQAMLGKQFMMHYDLMERNTYLVCGSYTEVKTLTGALPGLEIEESATKSTPLSEATCIIAACRGSGGNVVDQITKVFAGTHAHLFVVFVPARREEVMAAKVRAERMLSGKETGFTESTSTRGDVMSQTASRHRETYFGSDEKDVLLDILDSLKSSALANCKAYKCIMFVCGDRLKIIDYINAKLPVVESFEVRAGSAEEIYDMATRIDALPLDASRAAMLLGFSDTVRTSRIVQTAGQRSSGDVELGQALEGSVKRTGRNVLSEASSLNLGTLISGVPGTGKTFAAMHIAGQLVKKGGTHIAVISPTEEWNGFGYANKLRVVSLHDSRLRLNFFKCDSAIGVQRFYENLAMLLASASEAGPYTNSLEKCILAAFRKVYAQGSVPDPLKVYDSIEEAIVEQHGKRVGNGVKYTKHGENNRAALENLRTMLNRPEFSKKEGEDFADLLEQGAVFDLSGLSNKMKRFYYALILNQIYSIADTFDTNGDRELRLLVCLEEAQIVLGEERDSAAASDLEQRIQDFRKRGVGLVLITHSVTEIEPSIRRLCQTKMYFRQNSDVTRFAAADLLFGEADKDVLIERLKGLEQRTCAVNYMQGRERASACFLMLPEEQAEFGESRQPDASAREAEGFGDAVATLTDKEGVKQGGVRVQLFYVGEKVCEGITDHDGSVSLGRTIKGNAYRLVVLGEKKKDSRTFNIIGGEINIVRI